MAGGIAVNLHGRCLFGNDVDLPRPRIDNAFGVQMFPRRRQKRPVGQIGGGAAGENANVEQAIIRPRQRQHRKSRSVFCDIAYERDSRGGRKNFAIICPDRQRWIPI